MNPRYSILHPTARPAKWREIYDAWIDSASDHERVEYILCFDRRWGFTDEIVDGLGEWLEDRPGLNVVVENNLRRCYVESVNRAASGAHGDTLIVIADDQWPCATEAVGWDVELSSVLLRHLNGTVIRDGAGACLEYVVQVSTGTPTEFERGIIVMPILSKARYDRLGYVFYPRYESMYADNDFYEHALQDHVIVDARGLMFPHRHPIADKSIPWDDQYQAQNRKEAYKLGSDLLFKRRVVEFRDVPEDAPAFAGQRLLMCCLPGETYSAPWVCTWTQLLGHMWSKGFAVGSKFDYSSSAYVTRQNMANELLAMAPRPEYVLWIDDDNLVSPEVFDRLLRSLEALPEAAAVFAWTWVDGMNTTVSCGKFSKDQNTVCPVPAGEMERLKGQGLIEVEWSGFPAVLMRMSVLEQAGDRPFMPLPAPNSPWGLSGEDVAFCVNVKARTGMKIYVDPECFVPHLKLRAIGPINTIQAAVPAVGETVQV